MGRLPSGAYRVQARRTIDGIHERRSFTAPTKKAALIAAAEWQAEAERVASVPLSVAVRQYIDGLRGVRSPSTVRGYVNILHAIEADPLGQIPVDILTQKDVSRAFQRWTASASPKTLRNRHGLISAALKAARPSMHLSTPLPEKAHNAASVPSDGDVRALLDDTRGTALYVPVILGALAGMRRGEIVALDVGDIRDGYIYIAHALAVDDVGRVTEKAPKSAAGVRRVPVPEMLLPILPEHGRVCALSPQALTSAWGRLMQKRKADGLPVFRFHDLRHFCASRLHALGVPDAYIMSWLGWQSDTVLKAIYRHVLPDEEQTQAAKIRAGLKKWHTKRHTNIKKPRK